MDKFCYDIEVSWKWNVICKCCRGVWYYLSNLIIDLRSLRYFDGWIMFFWLFFIENWVLWDLGCFGG